MKQALHIAEISHYLPHRYPFLLIDRVCDYELKKWIHAYKNVTINEPFFSGHFPGYPVMPGVLILESLAQAAGVLAFHSFTDQLNADTLMLFVGIDDARFRRQVTPGDQLHLHVDVLRQMRGVLRCKGVAKVDGEEVTSATMLFARQDRKSV